MGAGAEWKKVDTGKLLALHRAGWTGKKIAEELKVSEATVSSYLKKNGGSKMKERLKEFAINTIAMAWIGIIIGGGVALGFFAVSALLIH